MAWGARHCPPFRVSSEVVVGVKEVHPLFQPPVRLREGEEVPQAEEATLPPLDLCKYLRPVEEQKLKARY